MNGYKNKTPIYAVYRRNPPQNKGHIQTENFTVNGDQNKAGAAILISDKIDFEIKGHEKRQRRTLHNDQCDHYDHIVINDQLIIMINPRRRYTKYKYICTQHRNTTVCKANANKCERGN